MVLRIKNILKDNILLFYLLICMFSIVSCKWEPDFSPEKDPVTQPESGGSENEERPPAPANPDLYYIILDPNGGTGERLYEERGKNTVYYSAYTSFSKDGCSFLGWAESKTAETILYADGSPIPVTGNRLLYAVWVPESEAYTVTFDLKGGADNGMPEKLSCRPGGSIRLPSLDNTYKAGYVRDGYSPDGTAASGVLKAETEFFPTADTTLCVVWGDGRSPQYAGEEKWVRGVTVTPQDWKTWWSEYGEKTAFWHSAAGWYDIYQGEKYLCWAAVASDMLLWWYDLNKESVDRYMADHPQISYPRFSYDGKGGSDLFSYFEAHWPDGGNQPTFGLNWFLTGNSGISGGALFKDLFDGREVTYRSTTVSQAPFNKILTEALESGHCAAAEIDSYGSHAVTVWGVRYGSDGFIDRLYITDSAIANEFDGTSYGGLQYTPVTYGSDGTAFIGYNRGSMQAPVRTLYTFSSCEEIWNEY